MKKSHADPGSDRPDAAIVKVEERDRDGRLLHEGEFQGEFPDRQAAVEAIELHLRQFKSVGYDPAEDFWWGSSLTDRQTRFLIK